MYGMSDDEQPHSTAIRTTATGNLLNLSHFFSICIIFQMLLYFNEHLSSLGNINFDQITISKPKSKFAFIF